ncbi:MAG: HEAT repeat domain-containing protein [Spirochaetia bacterium]
MNTYLELLSSRPIWMYVSALALISAVAILISRYTYLRKKIKQEVAACAETHPSMQPSCAFSLPSKTLSAHFRLIKKLSRRYGINLPVLMHLDDYWIQQLSARPRSALMQKLLQYSPDKALFPCFQAALDSSKRFEVLKNWIDKSGEFMVMGTIADSCAGRVFDGQKALPLIEPWKEELYEMTGDQRWTSRWFSLRILLFDAGERSQKAIWAAFNDSSLKIREMIARSFQKTKTNEGQLYEQLQDLLLNDPVYEVRSTARQRIEADCIDRYAIPSSLNHTQKLHITELLNPGIQQDREYAFSLLDGQDDELMLEAARVLNRSGSLRRLFLQAFHEDHPSLKRSRHLLENAARVHCSDFLSALEDSSNPGTLQIAAELLRSYGDRTHITTLLQRVRSFADEQKQREPLRSIYLSAMETACLRGDDNSLALLRDELSIRKSDAQLHEHILPMLPAAHAHVYINTLFSFLYDSNYPNKQTLRSTLARLEPELTLPTLFDLIKSIHPKVSASTQEQALRLLCEIGIPYTLQHVLEHLPLLEIEQASRYAELLAQHFGKTFQKRTIELLETKDARLRSRLISALPPQYHPALKAQLLEAVQDADPEVRSACAWTLVSTGDEEERRRCLPLIHDPVESVRISAARAFAIHAGPDYFDELKQVLESKNEMLPVQTSVIEGLIRSPYVESVDLLVQQIQSGGELQGAALKALREKHSHKMISRVLEHIQTAESDTRSRLLSALRSMGDSAESVLETYLFESTHPLRSIAVEVLESIGAVDAQIRHLTNRDPSVRREAAAFLFHAGSLSAYRGLVQAARDPDEEVRAYVVRALDALDSDRGRTILEELKKDPQKKIRTYTNWALERHQARRL